MNSQSCENDSLTDWFYRPTWSLAAAWFRIASGVVLLLTVSLFSFYLKEFFSNEGYVTNKVAQSLQSAGGGGNGFSIFFLYEAPWFVYCAYIGLIVSALCYTVGLFSRPAVLVSFALYVSFYNRFPLIGFGGSEILMMHLFFASFLQTDCRLVPRWVRKITKKDQEKDKVWIPGWPAQLIKMNLAIIYLFAAITKLTHRCWTDGHELGGLLNSYYGVWNFWWIGELPLLTAFLTYSSIAIELTTPFFIWFNSTRIYAIIAAILMHAGIALMINVTYFSEVMIASLVLFVTPRDIIHLKQLQRFAMFRLRIKPLSIILASILLILCGWNAFGYKIWWSSLNNSCPVGYIWTPGDAEYGTLPGFCVMKYEAKRDQGQIVSSPYTQPWVNITKEEAIAACRTQGSGYDLISDKEWLTIAYNIARTPINDISQEPGLQLAVGNVNDRRSYGAKHVDDPFTWGCDLTKPLHDPVNEYKQYRCEIRGQKDNLFREKGYSGMNIGYYLRRKVYDAGKSRDRSRLRTLVLSNGSTIWDFSGNVWEWADSALVKERKTGKGEGVGVDSDGITDEMPSPKINPTKTQFHFYDQITNWKGLEYLAPKDGLLCKNGIGKIYLDPGDSWGAQTEEERSLKAMIRGGAWGNPTEAGILSLNISHAPSDRTGYIGFRCVKRHT